MRVTFVLPPAGLSGGLRVVVIYAQHLQKVGHTVTVVSPAHPRRTLRASLRGLVRGEKLPARTRRSHLDGSGLDHRVLERFRPVTDDDVPDADVIVATWWETAEWIYRLSPRKGVKIHFVQGFEPHLYVPLERCEAVQRLPIHRIVVSRWLADLLHERYGHRNLPLVPNSVDRDQFHAPVRGKQAVPTVGFVFAPGRTKGADSGVAAIEPLRAKYPGLRVVAFGSAAPSRDDPLPAWVEMTVKPPQAALKDFYASCDAWISSSRSEGFGLPVLEAMACRTPVVATRTGWPLEAIVSGENGVLVDVDDVPAMTAGLDWILSLDDSRWRALSARAFETASEGSWAESARMFEAALVRAVEQGDAGSRGQQGPRDAARGLATAG